jgi:4-hydroxybenzoate polyprenyltransferase
VNIKQKLKDFNELVMFKHTIFSIPFIFIAMIVASSGWFGWKLFFLGLVASITARNFAMGFNRYMDRDIDKLNPRTANRPSVDGRISPAQTLAFTIINAIIFVSIAYIVNDLAFYTSFPILVVIGGYSLFKRFSYLAHIVLGISLGLAPIAGVIAVSSEVPLWAIYLSSGVVFWVAGFDLLYSLQDIDVDTKLKLHSIPSKFGAKNTLLISKIFHTLTILFWSMFIISADLGIFGKLAVLFSTIMLFMEHRIVNRDFKQIDRAFFEINGYLGIMFLVMIILEHI